MYVFDSALDEARINEKLERFHGLITDDKGGQVTAVDHWGKRRLAYAIGDKENGYYVVSQFAAEPAALPEYERVLKLDDELLRYLIVINEGHLTTSPALVEESKGEDDETTDEED